MRETELNIGDWVVHGELHTIERAGEQRRLGPKVMALLLCLARRPGRVLAKQELVDQVWEGAFTSDEAIAAVIYELRKALGDDAKQPAYVETIRGSGYRLVAPVRSRSTPPGIAATGGGGRSHRQGRRRRLRWLAGAALVLALGSLAAVAARRGTPSAEQPVGKPAAGPALALSSSAGSPASSAGAVRSLAVLPLATLVGGDLGQSELALGLTQALSAELANRRPVELAPLPEGAGADRWDQRAVARNLEVGAVLEGSIYRSEDRLLVSMQLVDLDSGAMLWGRTYERTLGDELAVQLELARSIAAEVDGHLRQR
jgi:DNA-binding winged helix-turn-helix (wHTH) protein/TolB-like protein